MLILTESTLYFLNLTSKFRRKKFSLSGQVNNWRDQVEPLSKGKSSKGTSGRSGTSIPCSTTDSRLTTTSVTSATTFSQATEPPSTPLKTLKALLEATCSDNDDDDEEESDSEERAAIVAETGKGKAAMKVSAVISGESVLTIYFRLLSKLTVVQMLNCTQLQSRDMEETKLPLAVRR